MAFRNTLFFFHFLVICDLKNGELILLSTANIVQKWRYYAQTKQIYFIKSKTRLNACFVKQEYNVAGHTTNFHRRIPKIEFRNP